MSSDTTQVPAAVQTVTVYLRVRGGAEAIAFYEKAFGAVEQPGRLLGPTGKIMHTAMTIGTSEVMLSEESAEWDSPGPQTLGGTSVSISLMVPDVDAVVARAVEAGATLKFPVSDQFYGHRSGRITDPFGHVWVINTKIEDVSPEEMQRRMSAWAAENA
jgi:PhnB protein